MSYSIKIIYLDIIWSLTDNMRDEYDDSLTCLRHGKTQKWKLLDWEKLQSNPKYYEHRVKMNITKNTILNLFSAKSTNMQQVSMTMLNKYPLHHNQIMLESYTYSMISSLKRKFGFQNGFKLTILYVSKNCKIFFTYF